MKIVDCSEKQFVNDFSGLIVDLWYGDKYDTQNKQHTEHINAKSTSLLKISAWRFVLILMTVNQWVSFGTSTIQVLRVWILREKTHISFRAGYLKNSGGRAPEPCY